MATELLLVEDDQHIGITLSEVLSEHGYVVTWAKTCAEAQGWMDQRNFAVAIFDISLPDGNGMDSAKILRTKQESCALLFLSALNDHSLKIEGLEVGAEDYITKPFHLKELLLRVRNALKRNHYFHATQGLTAVETWVSIGKVEVDFATHTLKRGTSFTQLKTKESEILKLLYTRRDAVVSRDEILNFIWKAEQYPSPRTVDNFIVALRKLIEEDPNHPVHLISVRGVGYQLIRSLRTTPESE